MSFQSMVFAVFLLLTLCFYYAIPAKLRLWGLLFANAVFFCWADWRAGLWLAISVVTTWGTAICMEKWNAGPKKDGSFRQQAERTPCKKADLLLAVCLAVNLGLLVVFRYLPVWDGLLNAAFGRGIRVVHLDIAGRLGWAVPLGISFYTLQAVGYLLDVRQGKYPAQNSLLRYAVFISFFPNILSGPIERGGHMMGQMDRILTARRRELLDYDRMAKAFISILLGFFMKMVLADRAALLVDYLYGMYRDGNSFTMLMAALFYAVQIYCDFASYSYIASGVAALFGFALVQNFRQPYLAAGFSDFWKRWHISLSSWLRDYVYIPLGGNRKGSLRRYLNLLLVFLVSGLWHGGAPTFLVWGLGHGLCQVLEDCLQKSGGKKNAGEKNAGEKNSGEKCGGALPGGCRTFLGGLRRVLSSFLTFLAVSLLWIFFRSESLEMALVCIRNLFTRWQGFLYAKKFLFVMGLDRIEFGIALGAALLLFVIDLISEKTKQEASAWIYASPLPIRWGLCLILIMSIFVCGMYGPGFDASGFIYVDF